MIKIGSYYKLAMLRKQHTDYVKVTLIRDKIYYDVAFDNVQCTIGCWSNQDTFEERFEEVSELEGIINGPYLKREK